MLQCIKREPSFKNINESLNEGTIQQFRDKNKVKSICFPEISRV